jgi:hypothetical protein
MPSLIPYQLLQRKGGLSIRWLAAEPTDFQDPSFGGTIDRLLTQALQQVGVTETPASELSRIATQNAEFMPTGFIHHVSRCGSTLLANMLSCVAEHIVLSEPSVPLGILSKNLFNPLADTREIPEMLRGSLVAFYQAGTPHIRRLFVKFFSGNIFQLELIRRTFPGVREIFLYRDPIEVIVSNVYSGVIQGWLWIDAITGIPFPSAIELSMIELAARAIGRKMTAMVSNYRPGTTLLMNYSEINVATPRLLLDFFGAPITQGDLIRMEGKLRIASKDPEQERIFESDSSRKQEDAGPTIRKCAEEFAYPAFRQLEALRATRI